MHATSPDYDVRFDPDANVVRFQGSLRLNAASEYAPISNLLDAALAHNTPGEVRWDLRGLEYLNSSGINMLYQFVVKVRKLGNVHMSVTGSNEVPWQQKSLVNMTRFMPSLKLTLE